MQNYPKTIKLVVLVSICLYVLGKALESWLNISGLFSLGASVAVIALIITAFYILWNNYLWKIKKFKFSSILSYLCGFHNYPDLSGQWKGTYYSSYKFDYENNEYVTTGEIQMDVTQSYLSIKIKCKFGESSDSKSFFATLLQDEHGDWGLIYAYRNDPKDLKLQSAAGGGIHEGFTYLKILNNGSKFEGYYTTDEIRRTRGRMILERTTR